MPKVLDRFEEAAINLAFIGSMDPDEHEHIEKEYKRAKAALERALTKNLVRRISSPKDQA